MSTRCPAQVKRTPTPLIGRESTAETGIGLQRESRRHPEDVANGRLHRRRRRGGDDPRTRAPRRRPLDPRARERPGRRPRGARRRRGRRPRVQRAAARPRARPRRHDRGVAGPVHALPRPRTTRAGRSARGAWSRTRRAAEAMLGVPAGELDRDPWETLGEPGPGFDPARIESAGAILVGRRNLADLDVGDAHACVTGAIATRVESGRVEVRDLEGRRGRGRGGVGRPRRRRDRDARDSCSRQAWAATRRAAPSRTTRSASPRASSAEPGHLQDMYGMRLRHGLRYYPKLLLAPGLRAAGEPGCMANVVFRYGVGLVARGAAPPAARAPGADAATRCATSSSSPAACRSCRRAPCASRVGASPHPAPESISVLAIVEPQPRPESRISLADELDPLGVPRARVDWRLGEEERTVDRHLPHRSRRGDAADGRRRTRA